MYALLVIFEQFLHGERLRFAMLHHPPLIIEECRCYITSDANRLGQVLLLHILKFFVEDMRWQCIQVVLTRADDGLHLLFQH